MFLASRYFHVLSIDKKQRFCVSIDCTKSVHAMLKAKTVNCQRLCWYSSSQSPSEGFNTVNYVIWFFFKHTKRLHEFLEESV